MYVRFHDKFDGKEIDPRGFAKSKTGAYGTAGWMSETDMNEVLEISPVEKAGGVILVNIREKLFVCRKIQGLTGI
ncbi:MAG: hypothetical protein L6V93_02350 [Clostridiales bacterium]|nr:MAG: hypothetical protein L6V93_02350 [Clostridiales bacterium]